MNTVNIMLFDSPMMNIGLAFLALTIVIRLVRWVLDILP